MTNIEEGFHIMEKKSVEKNNLPTFEKMSIIRWMQNIRNRGFEAFGDYTIVGFEDLFSQVGNRDDLAKYLRKMLVENANYLVNTGATFQFVIKESIEMWESPIIKTKKGEIIKLSPIFGVMVRKDVDWFYQELNVQS